MSDDVLLDVQDLCAGYGRAQVLDHVSLQVRRGDFTAIVGANGAGKTTLLKSLMGLVPAQGRVDFAGTNLLGEPAHRRVRRGIAYVPEGRRVFASMTVEENLRVVAPREHVQERLQQAYDIFPRLGERRRQDSASLSGGEQQMLALARALVLQPQLLIVDEISLGLAPVVVDQMFDLFLTMHAEGRTILVAEQNVETTLDAATTAYVLDTGRITLSGPAGTVREDPRVVAAYL